MCFWLFGKEYCVLKRLNGFGGDLGTVSLLDLWAWKCVQIYRANLIWFNKGRCLCLCWTPAGARAMGGLYPGPTDLSWGDSIDCLKWIMSRVVLLGHPQLPILTKSQVVCRMLKLWCHIPGLWDLPVGYGWPEQLRTNHFVEDFSKVWRLCAPSLYPLNLC